MTAATNTNRRALSFLVGVLWTSGVWAQMVTVSAPNRDYGEIPVSVRVPPHLAVGVPVLTEVGTGKEVPAQLLHTAGATEVCWLERDLKQGTTRRYRISWVGGRTTSPAREVIVREIPAAGADSKRETSSAVEVTLRGKLWTRYVFAGVPKPFCYPLMGPTDKPLTRGYPMEDIEGESRDHRHHRSAFWFAHDDVNGEHFWGEGRGSARQVQRQLLKLVGGPVLGRIATRNDWIGRDGKKVCDDLRDLRFYNTREGRLIDFAITIHATEGPVTFGDTKEGTFGFRVAHTMKVSAGGHIQNARGDRDGRAWGKRADWCDYYGPVDGDIVGIAVFDAPTNVRHPTYWHVRTYGLFAANPFGVRFFTHDKTANGAYTLPAGDSLTFRYRVWLHRGTTDEAHVARRYAAFAEAPTVRLDPGRRK